MDLAPFKCLFWNTNDSVLKLMVSITSDVSLWYRSCYRNMLHYDNGNKCRKLTTIQSRYWLSLRALTWLEKLKNLSSNFEQIA